jgi:hypothetical protein
MTATGEWAGTGKHEWKIADGRGPQFTAKSVSGALTVNASTDAGLNLIDEQPVHAPEVKSEPGATSGKDGEVNINLDIEIERAKGWIKDLAKKVSVVIEGEPVNRSHSDETTIIDPVAPQQPVVPEAPVAPEPPVSPQAAADDAARSATAQRRAHLLEAVKNGQMTVDEALAALEQDA